MSFETYKEKSARIGDCMKPLVVIFHNGKFAYFNKVASQQYLIKKFSHITLHADKENQLAWFELTNEPEDYSVPIKIHMEDCFAFALRNFMRYFDIQIKSTVAFELKLEGKKIIGDFLKPYLIKKERGKNKIDSDEENDEPVLEHRDKFDLCRRLGYLLLVGKEPRSVNELAGELEKQKYDFRGQNPLVTVKSVLLENMPNKFIKNNGTWDLATEYQEMLEEERDK